MNELTTMPVLQSTYGRNSGICDHDGCYQETSGDDDVCVLHKSLSTGYGPDNELFVMDPTRTLAPELLLLLSGCTPQKRMAHVSARLNNILCYACTRQSSNWFIMNSVMTSFASNPWGEFPAVDIDTTTDFRKYLDSSQKATYQILVDDIFAKGSVLIEVTPDQLLQGALISAFSMNLPQLPDDEPLLGSDIVYGKVISLQ